MPLWTLLGVATSADGADEVVIRTPADDYLRLPLSLLLGLVPGLAIGQDVADGTAQHVLYVDADGKLAQLLPLTVPKGGTGADAFTAGKLLKGSGTAALSESSITDDGAHVTVTLPVIVQTSTPVAANVFQGYDATADFINFQIGRAGGVSIAFSYYVPLGTGTVIVPGTMALRGADHVRQFGNEFGETFSAGRVVTIWLPSSTGADRERYRLRPLVTDNTDATRKYGVACDVYDSVAREAWRAWATGVAAAIGFLGADPSERLIDPDVGDLLIAFGFAAGDVTIEANHIEGQLRPDQFQAGDNGFILGVVAGVTQWVAVEDGYFAAPSIQYAAGTPADWAGGSPATNVANALDRIAAALTGLGLSP